MPVLIAELLFLIGNYIVAKIQSHLFSQNERINHGLWLTVYVAVAIICSLLLHNWIVFMVLVLQRMVIFNPILNLLREKAFFYTDTADPQGSWFDRLWGKWYPTVWIISALSLITLNLIMFIR